MDNLGTPISRSRFLFPVLCVKYKNCVGIF